MAIVKKGSRRIVVDGLEYRWRVRRKIFIDQGLPPMTCSVQRAVDRPGSILVVCFPQTHPAYVRPGEAIPATPSQVERAIRQALIQGWHPLQSGAPFILFVKDEE
jgi:hypothetical protein